MKRGGLTKLRRLVNDFNPARREFLRTALGGTLGLATAYLASRFIPIAHAETLLPYVKPETIIDKESLRRPYVLVFRDGVYAVAVNENGREIARSPDHAEVIQEALAYSREVSKQYSIIFGDAIVETGSVVLLLPGTYNIDAPIEFNRGDCVFGLNLYTPDDGNGCNQLVLEYIIVAKAVATVYINLV